MDKLYACEKIERLLVDADKMNEVVNGDESKTVDLGGVATPSLRRFFSLIDERESNAAKEVTEEHSTKMKNLETALKETVKETLDNYDKKLANVVDTAKAEVAAVTGEHRETLENLVTTTTEKAEEAKGWAEKAKDAVDLPLASATKAGLMMVGDGLEADEEGRVKVSSGDGDGEFIRVQNSAGAHNAIYRYENLEDKFTLEELSEKLTNADFSGIYIGGYIDRRLDTGSGGYTDVRFLVAGIDTYFNSGVGKRVEKHHLVMVPENLLRTNTKMNKTATTAGGFMGSSVFQEILPTCATFIKDALGEEHVLTWTVALSNAVNAEMLSMAGCGLVGASSSIAAATIDLCLLSELQVFGSAIYSSSPFDICFFNQMLPLFSLAPEKRMVMARYNLPAAGTNDYWLSGVASSTEFASVSSVGLATNSKVTYAIAIRPFFMFV